MDDDRADGRASSPPSPPRRTCIGCRATDDRSGLLRIVAVTDDGGRAIAVPDPGASMPGRGAWLHPDLDCVDLAGRRRAFSRALRREVTGADAVRALLETLRSTSS